MESVTVSSGTFSFSVTGVIDAPVLDNAGTMTLTTITEIKPTTAAKRLLRSLLRLGEIASQISIVELWEGIAITATTNGNGSWEYSTDNGTSWNAVGSVADNSALLLRSTDLVRFVPNGQSATTGDITFRAWDQTSGTFGTKVDASTHGGTTAFSSATETASITITEVNDEQILATNTGATVAENSTGNVITAAMLATTDVDHTAAQLTYTVTGLSTNGTLRRNGVALAMNSTFTQADIKRRSSHLRSQRQRNQQRCLQL